MLREHDGLADLKGREQPFCLVQPVCRTGEVDGVAADDNEMRDCGCHERVCIIAGFFYLRVRYSNCLFLYFNVYLVRDVLRPGVVEIIHGARGILSVCGGGGLIVPEDKISTIDNAVSE